MWTLEAQREQPLVYADWLEESGCADEAALVRVNVALATLGRPHLQVYCDPRDHLGGGHWLVSVTGYLHRGIELAFGQLRQPRLDYVSDFMELFDEEPLCIGDRLDLEVAQQGARNNKLLRGRLITEFRDSEFGEVFVYCVKDTGSGKRFNQKRFDELKAHEAMLYKSLVGDLSAFNVWSDT